MLSCKHCGFGFEHDMEKCRRDSRYEIEEVIKAEITHGPFDVYDDMEEIADWVEENL